MESLHSVKPSADVRWRSRQTGLPGYEPVTILSRLLEASMSTAAAASSKALTKKELKKFQELLEEKRKAVLERALKKIEDGTFGVCEICEEPIGKKRLEARPETTLCIKCKEDQEREERTMG